MITETTCYAVDKLKNTVNADINNIDWYHVLFCSECKITIKMFLRNMAESEDTDWDLYLSIKNFLNRLTLIYGDISWIISENYYNRVNLPSSVVIEVMKIVISYSLKHGLIPSKITDLAEGGIGICYLSENGESICKIDLFNVNRFFCSCHDSIGKLLLTNYNLGKMGGWELDNSSKSLNNAFENIKIVLENGRIKDEK